MKSIPLGGGGESQYIYYKQEEKALFSPISKGLNLGSSIRNSECESILQNSMSF